jgi:hypothetical protein
MARIQTPFFCRPNRRDSLVALKISASDAWRGAHPRGLWTPPHFRGFTGSAFQPFHPQAGAPFCRKNERNPRGPAPAPNPRRTHMKAETRCKRAGRKAGKSAASWFYDPNKSCDVESLESFIEKLDNDVDPAVLDQLPFLDLSGQYADGWDDERVLEACGYASAERMLEREPERVDEIICWFREGHDEAVLRCVIREGKEQLAYMKKRASEQKAGVA